MPRWRVEEKCKDMAYLFEKACFENAVSGDSGKTLLSLEKINE